MKQNIIKFNKPFISSSTENNITKVTDFIGFEYDGFKWDGTSFVKEEN